MGKPLRNENIPGAAEMWAAVDRAGDRAPEWVKRKMDELWREAHPEAGEDEEFTKRKEKKMKMANTDFLDYLAQGIIEHKGELGEIISRDENSLSVQIEGETYTFDVRPEVAVSEDGKEIAFRIIFELRGRLSDEQGGRQE